MEAKYFEITESSGQRATKEQLERLYQRYRFACDYISGGSVLEVACGSGVGLGYIAKSASRVVGGDIDRKNVEAAGDYYRGNREITVLRLDAHDIPLKDASFDTILLFEAIYYLEQPAQFISEAHRLLKYRGNLIICTVNKSWKDFHPSKYSFTYFTAPELVALLQSKFTHVKLYGAFEVSDTGIISNAFSLMKRTASRLNLIPGSLKAREVLKRLFIGRLVQIPDVISDGIADYLEPIPIASDCQTDKYTIVYAVATKWNHLA